jgi:hypothetical protein
VRPCLNVEERVPPHRRNRIESGAWLARIGSHGVREAAAIGTDERLFSVIHGVR